MTPKIKTVGQNFAFYECQIDQFQGKKTCFLGFLEVVFELFRAGILTAFSLKRLTLGIFLALKVNFLLSL